MNFQSARQSFLDARGRAFQAALLSAFTFVFLVVQISSFFVAGAPPELQYGVRRVSGTGRIVTSVTPGAAHAGLRVNDQYDWANGTPAQCAQRFMAQRVGRVFELPVVRGGSLHPVGIMVRPMSHEDMWNLISATIFKVTGMLVGILLVARGAGLFGYLSGLAFFGTAAVVGESNNAVLSFRSQVILYGAVGAVGAAFFYLHVEAVLELCKAAVVWRWLLRLPALLVAAYIILTRAQYVQHGLYDPCHSSTDAGHYYWGLIFLWLWPLIGYVAVAFDASARNRLADPSLARWMFLTYLLGGSGPVANLYFQVTAHQHPYDHYLNVTYPIMGFGFVYIGLHHRLLNVRWLIDRALIYGVTLAVDVFVFAGFELGLARFGAGIGQRSENVGLELLLTGVLAVLFRPLRGVVDRLFERVIFRHRHEVENALARFTRESHAFRAPDQFLKYACEEVLRIIDASQVAYYESNAEGGLVLRAYWNAADCTVGAPQFVSFDDVAVLRAHVIKQAVNLHDTKSALGDDGMLFPIHFRRALGGALLCRHNSEHSGVRPEDSDLLIKVARSIHLCARKLLQ